MKLFSILFYIFIGVIFGAVVLPVVMFGLFQLFALAGGDIPQMLRRFESPRGTPELWATFFYRILGGSLGGLSSYFIICLRKQTLQNWVRLCLFVIGFSLFSLVHSWFKVSTDGYNTMTEAFVLLWLPTVWCISLLFWGVSSSKRLIKQAQK